MAVPAIRINTLVDLPVNATGDHVLYWMTATRRTSWNFSLDHAIDLATRLDKPLIVLEPLRAGYRWACDRFHAFVAQGMADNAAAFAAANVAYHPYLEPQPGDGKGLLLALAANACVVVGDDWPSFFMPKMQQAAALQLREIGVRFDVVDSNGLLPIRAAGEQVFGTAHSFRRFLHKTLPKHLFERPASSPLTNLKLPTTTIPKAVREQWPAATDLSGSPSSLAHLPIDHSIGPVELRGGEVAARAHAQAFLARRLKSYVDDRSVPDKNGQSGLSPWLHWGHISTHEIVDLLWQAEGFTPASLSSTPTGSREGWWGMSAAAEAFLDELVTWREVGFNMSSRVADYDRWSSLPGWAKTTLLEHLGDHREHVYRLDDLDTAATYDPLWNAAQKQLVREGVIHNYLRMLWGKKVLQWSKDPRVAVEHLIELNNRYAIDGRDPNSYSGIFWVFGRYDRPWGPVRPIFGAIRYMTSENTQKKHDCGAYLERYNGPSTTTKKKRATSTKKPTTKQADMW